VDWHLEALCRHLPRAKIHAREWLAGKGAFSKKAELKQEAGGQLVGEIRLETLQAQK
jgi:hypothetical protein